MGDNDSVTREDMREIARRLERVETSQAAMMVNQAVLMDFMAETRARNRSLPGWLLAAGGLALPILGALASAWAGGKVP